MNTESLIAKLDAVKLDILSLTTNKKESIGIGVTTHNRPDVYWKTINEIRKRSPGCKIVIVDDASKDPVPDATFRFDENVGIAIAKNKCFELLEDCTHIFLFDDDTYPLVDDWMLPYINAGQPHLMYIFDHMQGRKMGDIHTIYEDSRIKAYTHPRGCMMYFHQSCLKQVGGMYPAYGKWGWEHPDLSNRIYNNHMTMFRFMDVANSKGLFHAGDEHVTVASTVNGSHKDLQIKRNEPIYNARQDAKEFIPYKMENNIILTCLFFGVPDPQRGKKWTDEDINLQPLLKSLNGLNLVILTDDPVRAHLLAGTGQYNITCVKVEATVNPYFQRWIAYYQYLSENRGKYDKVFCVDATDVEVLRNPFNEMEDLKLYTGDEPDNLSSEWLNAHHRHPKLQEFFKSNSRKQLLNAGLLGGKADIVRMFAHHMVSFYSQALGEALHRSVPDAGATDMGTFNFVAYMGFSPFLTHGNIVNTRFKANEYNNYSWFKHK